MRKKQSLMLLILLTMLLWLSSSVFAQVQSPNPKACDKQGVLLLQVNGEVHQVPYVEQMEDTAKRYTLDISGLDAVPEEQKTAAAGELLRQIGFTDAAEELSEETLLTMVSGTELSILRQNASRNEEHYFAVARTQYSDYQHFIVGFANHIDPELTWKLQLQSDMRYSVDHEKTHIMLYYTDRSESVQRQIWIAPTQSEAGEDQLLVYERDLWTGSGEGIAFHFTFAKKNVSEVFLEATFCANVFSVKNPAETDPVISGSLQTDTTQAYHILVDFPQGFRVKFCEQYGPLQLD